MSLRRFDLNLLTVFDVLIEEKNVTKSAERLAMSQPAVSHALSRLRQQLDDPILVRAGEGMQPSPRALEIHHDLHDALMQIERIISPQPRFDPASSTREFAIASTDYVESLILPPLLSRIQEQAPGIELRTHHLASTLPLDDIENGTIDLAISMSVKVPKRFKTQALLQDDYMCAVAANHPVVGKTLDMDTYLELDHLLVVPAKSRQQVAKSLFAGIDKAPRVVANMPHFLAALHATSESSLIVTGPTLLLKKFQKAFGLALIRPPFDLPPFQIDLIWHQFKDADAGLDWLRKQIQEITNDVQ